MFGASMSAAREEKETSFKERDNFSLGATKSQSATNVYGNMQRSTRDSVNSPFLKCRNNI